MKMDRLKHIAWFDICVLLYVSYYLMLCSVNDSDGST